MTINIQTEYTSPVDPLWNMIDKLAPGHVVFVRGKRDDLVKIEQNAFMMPMKDRLFFSDQRDFDLIPLDGKLEFVSEPKIRDFNGVVVLDYRVDISKLWREIVDINRSNVYVFFERYEYEYLDTPSISIR